MDIIATPGASDANSYVDEEYADVYFETRLGSAAWTESDEDDDKVTALQQATRVLDSLYDWNGWQTSSTQALRWPRDGAENYDQAFGPNSMFDFDSTLTAYFENTIIPKQIKDAVCELAITLLVNVGYTASVNDLKLVKVGPLRVDFNDKVANYTIPTAVIEMLRHMGSYQGTSGGSAIMTPRLVRV